MKLKIKQAWIKALLSGRYKQVNGALKDQGAYCCLGVLCKVAEPRVKWKDNTFKGETCIPPDSTLKAVGLKKRSARALANLNDRGKSFKGIAAYIKSHY